MKNIPAGTQTIFRVRRDYNAWVADETMEDYALRFTPKNFRKWPEWRVASTAFGSLSFLALEAIGGAMAMNYGFSNAMWAIALLGLVIFLTSFPIAYYAATFGLDLDLLTRGAGFGYLGSTITSLIYAVFTFIFFALEAAILALALQLVVPWPLPVCYILSSLVVIPIAMKGITLISKLQAWTQIPWLLMLFAPFVWIALNRPELYAEFTELSGFRSGSSHFSWLMFGSASAVGFSLVVQIGEQVDFLRFMPERTSANKIRWWSAVIAAGPGWALMGVLKMAAGAFLAFAALQYEVDPARATEPTQMYLAGFHQVIGKPGIAVLVTFIFVVISQIKINVTNAYAGSLAWSNFFARVTRSHPGRVVWLVFNVAIALLLMLLGVFSALEKVLAVYSNVAIAWVGALVADLVINKPLGLSPKGIEFRRAYLFDFNPVGLASMVFGALAGVLGYFGFFGEISAAFSPVIALVVALLVSPLAALLTQGKFYIARAHDDSFKPGSVVRCAVCENQFEAEDMASCPAYAAPICSLCCSLETRCHDRCKTNSQGSAQLRSLMQKILPNNWLIKVNFRVAQYLGVTFSLCAVIACLMMVVFVEESAKTSAVILSGPMLKAFALMCLMASVGAWWIILTHESRRIAQDESERQTQLLLKEIEARKKTDLELQKAKDAADAANRAKTRYMAGMSHELRSPLNTMLGYTQILLKSSSIDTWARETLTTVQNSGRHMQDLIDDSLELARIEAGRLRLDKSVLPLSQFIADIEQMMSPQAQVKGLQFITKVTGKMPHWVTADAKWLRQVLINLLTNAIRFTNKGQVGLHIDFTQHVTSLEVFDSGAGIAPQDLERIFLPFERGSTGRKNNNTGTGLGLTITLLLVQLMGGDLKVRSIPGEGSVFTIRLYLPETSEPANWEVQHQNALRQVIGYLAPKRVLLLVDDEPIQRQLLAAMLLPLGFSIMEAASGSECLEILAQKKPDAVLLDLTMDELDGWETLARIRLKFSSAELPVIIVSANLFDKRSDELESLHCQGFVGKPTSESELLSALERGLEIEWIRDNSPKRASLTPSVSSDQSTNLDPISRVTETITKLPEDLREDLLRFASQGQGGRLHQRLREARVALPDHAQTLNHLQKIADSYDFEGLKNLLREVEE